ncbi:MAG: septum formation inhibitor Maf [Rhodocyclaceae bacterium]|nr:septum formation inhibitor Maf [Rhodocyclaceae bacterium]
MATSAARRIVLASTSKYRKLLLERFGLAFETARPDTDETALPDESPTATAERLALAKAQAVRSHYPDALIIGSDQVAHMDGQVFGKPGTVDAAIGQLTRMSGRTVVFDTALCLLDAASGEFRVETVPTRVRFRELVDDEIRRYVDIERPLDCAGSAKSEGLGITLLEALSGDDPTALVGLPLIALARMLRASGVCLP